MTFFVAGVKRYKNIRSLSQLLLYFVTRPLYYLGFLIPKDPFIWVFGNTFGFKDNARYLFTYIRDNHPEIRPIWIANKDPKNTAIRFRYLRFSVIGIWLQYRAGVCFVSTGQSDLAGFTLARTNIIQLWHGIPIKQILLDSPETLPFKKRSSLAYKISLKFLKSTLQRYSLIIASSETVQERLASAFGLPKQRFEITGYPRHDILFENSKDCKKWILYAPTWRRSPHDALTITNAICNHEFIDEIAKLGYKLWLSIHPLNKQIEEKFKHIRGLQIVADDQDVNYVLAQSEILITDYSSIAVDFSMLNRKVIFYTPDMNEYLQERGIYDEFRTIIENNGTRSSDQVLQGIVSTYRDCCISSDVFFRYRDTHSRKRIVDIVKKKFITK